MTTVLGAALGPSVQAAAMRLCKAAAGRSEALRIEVALKRSKSERAGVLAHTAEPASVSV